MSPCLQCCHVQSKTKEYEEEEQNVLHWGEQWGAHTPGKGAQLAMMPSSSEISFIVSQQPVSMT